MEEPKKEVVLTEKKEVGSVEEAQRARAIRFGIPLTPEVLASDVSKAARAKRSDSRLSFLEIEYSSDSVSQKTRNVSLRMTPKPKEPRDSESQLLQPPQKVQLLQTKNWRPELPDSVFQSAAQRENKPRSWRPERSDSEIRRRTTRRPRRRSRRASKDSEPNRNMISTF